MNPEKFGSVHDIFEYVLDEKERGTSVLSIGDWVKTPKGVGFIDIIGTVYAQVVIDRICFNFRVNEISSINSSLEIADYKALADLALATGDKAWFMEITEQMKIPV